MFLGHSVQLYTHSTMSSEGWKGPGIPLSLLPWTRKENRNHVSSVAVCSPVRSSSSATKPVPIKFIPAKWTQWFWTVQEPSPLRIPDDVVLGLSESWSKQILHWALVVHPRKRVKIGSPIQLTPARSGQGWLFRIDCYISAFIVWRISRRFAQPKNCDIF